MAPIPSRSPRDTVNNNSLALSAQLAYVAPTLMVAFLNGPIGIIQGMYAKHFGITLTTIATILLIARLFDAITDPLIGYLSDRHYNKYGSRKAFVVAGGLMVIISSYFLYVPVDPDSIDESVTVSPLYFLGCFLVFYLAWTLFEIPHLAWGSELAYSSEDKTKIYSLRTLSVIVGILLFYVVPLLPIFPGNEFTPQTLQWSAIIAGLLILPTLYCCVIYAPSKTGHTVGAPKIQQKQQLRQILGEFVRNKPFLLFIAALFLYSLGGSGMSFTLLFIFIDAYLGLGSDFALVNLIGLGIGVFMVGVWYRLANRIGKKSVMITGIFLYTLGIGLLAFLQPNNAGFTALAIVITTIHVASASLNAISPSLLADIIDYSTWKFGQDRAATYFAFFALVSKISLALGGAIGMGIAGWYGFNPAATDHSDESIAGLVLATCWIPILLMIISTAIIIRFPITSRRHAIIRKRLDNFYDSNRRLA